MPNRSTQKEGLVTTSLVVVVVLTGLFFLLRFMLGTEDLMSDVFPGGASGDGLQIAAPGQGN